MFLEYMEIKFAYSIIRRIRAYAYILYSIMRDRVRLN